MAMNLGLPELLLIFVVALVVFGPKRLPEIGQQLGKAVRDFKKAMSPDEIATDGPAPRPSPKLSDASSQETALVLSDPPTVTIARGQNDEPEPSALPEPPSAEGRV